MQFAARSGSLYDTTTSQQMMLRVKADPSSLEPAEPPEFVAGGRQWDDRLIDEDAGVAHVTTDREKAELYAKIGQRTVERDFLARRAGR